MSDPINSASKKPVKAPPKAVADYLFSAGATISGVEQQHQYQDNDEENDALKLKREEEDDVEAMSGMGSGSGGYRKDKKDEGDGIFRRGTNFMFQRGGRKYTSPGVKVLLLMSALIVVLLTFVVSAMTRGLRSGGNSEHYLAPPKNAILPSSLPAACTESQSKKIQEQLDIKTCPHGKGKPRNPNCGITVATAKGGQRGHSWLEQYLIESSDENGKIEAVFVDCQHDSGVNAVGALRLGSHQTKFSMEQWAEAYDSSKKHQILSKAYWDPSRMNVPAYDGVSLDTKVYCLSSNKQAEAHMHDTVKSLDWKGRLVPQFFSYNSTTLDDHLHDSTKLLSSSHPSTIQYLHLGSRGFDSKVMAGASKTLDRVEYLSFSYADKGTWKGQSFEDAIDHLKYKGFACYFDGYESYLWRITECYQPYFGMGHWSRVACVNTNLESTTNLASIMENVFLGTLAKSDVRYGTA